MSLTPGKLFQAGARRLQYAHRNSAGYPVGTVLDPDVIAANTTMHAYVIHGLRDFVPPKTEKSKAFDKSDNRVNAQMYMGVSDEGEGTFELGREDERFMAAVKRANLDTSLSSKMVFRPGNSAQVEPLPSYLIATTRVQNTDDGSYWYKSHIYHNVEITVDEEAPINQKDGENPSPLKFKFIPSLSNRIITGHLLSSTSMQVLEDTDTYMVVRSRYPLAVTSWKANGTATTFNLAHKPIYSDATGAADNIITKNGTTTAATSVNINTGLVTVTAGSNGDMWVVLYQTNFTPAA